MRELANRPALALKVEPVGRREGGKSSPVRGPRDHIKCRWPRACARVAVDPLIEFLFATASGVRGLCNYRRRCVLGERGAVRGVLLQSDSCVEKATDEMS